MKNLFPQEIINHSVENHFFKFSKQANTIYLSIIFMVVSVIISLPIIKTEITIQAKGIFRSASETSQIISPIVAEVIKTSIAENRFVTAGDTLIWFNKEEVKEKINHLKNLVSTNDYFINDISNILLYQYDFLQTELIRSDHSQYRQRIAEYNLKTNLLEKEYKRALNLYNKEVIPLIEMEQKEFELRQIKEEKKLFVQQKRNEWQRLQTDYQLQNKKYNIEILKFLKELKDHYILAPKSGYITNFSGVSPGSYLTTGQTVAEISPEDKLIAECIITPKDIGYLNSGMDVIFQVDAFNYNQWGLASGKIFDISNDIYLVNNQPFFKVKCSINESHLTLKNGYKGELKKGLTATTRFFITKRTLAQLLFDKIDNWLNPKILSS